MLWSLRRSPASAITRRSSATPASTALSVSKWDLVLPAMIWARVVLPLPGGPQRRIEENSRSDSIARRRSLPGPMISSCPDKFFDGARAHPRRQRRFAFHPFPQRVIEEVHGRKYSMRGKRNPRRHTKENRKNTKNY